MPGIQGDEGAPGMDGLHGSTGEKGSSVSSLLFRPLYLMEDYKTIWRVAKNIVFKKAVKRFCFP
jgi:hypothetical protein